MLVAVTGASGFVGAHVCQALLHRGWRVRALVRRNGAARVPAACELGVMPELDGAAWSDTVGGCDAVVHLAARVHRADRGERQLMDAYRRENVTATLDLARSARDLGLKRMVFMSTAKVFGETSSLTGFAPDDLPAPREPYSVSKLAAEQGLEAIADADNLRISVVRPPIVYGPGVSANFLRLMRFVDREWPVPVSDSALRSMVYVGNLADLCAHLLDVPIPSFATLLAADETTLSTRQLVERLAFDMGRRARVLRIPVSTARLLGRLPLVGPALQRLTSPLVIDAARSYLLAQWRPPIGVDEALGITVRWYVDELCR